MTPGRDIAASLSGLAVVDLGRGLAGGIAAKLLGDLGAQVRRFEAAADPFRGEQPAYDHWHRRAEVIRVASFDDPAVEAALVGADLCILGGEDHPDAPPLPDADALAWRHPALIVLAIEGYPTGSVDAARPATELLVQARSGLAAEQFSGRPFHLPFSPARYGAALHGVTGLLAALCGRARGGNGRVVRTSLYEGALTFGSQYWLTAEQGGPRFYATVPKDPRQIIVRCRDERYVHIVLGAAGAKGSLYRILRIEDPSVKPEDSGVPTGREEPRNFFGDIDLLSRHAEAFESAALMAELTAAGVPAAYVEAPGGCWDDPQVALLGTVETDGEGAAWIGRTVRGRLSDDEGARLPGNGSGPLAGVRVLDFGMFTAGPYASVVLADLGADVIKVETLQGDPSAGIATSYAVANRGKRMVVLDLKHPDGQAIGARLIASAHGVYNNFRPGVSARLGIDPATLLAADSNKVVLESTGFGRTGPGAKRPGFDMILQAYTGHEVRAGGAGNVPLWDRTILVDYAAGLLGQVALLVGLWRRASGRGGADLDVSLVDAGLFLLSDLVRDPAGTMHGPVLLDATQTGFHPASSLYRTRDGWIAVDAAGEAMRERLAALTGASGWDGTGRQAIAGWAADRDTAAALDALAQIEVWAERCEMAGRDALRRDAAPAGMLVTRPHQRFGAVTQLAALFRLDGCRPAAALGVPSRGEHTRAVLEELGYDAAAIDRFYADGVVA